VARLGGLRCGNPCLKSETWGTPCVSRSSLRNKAIVEDEMGKRNIFAELVEGVDAMKEHRAGKLTLRTHTLPVPEIRASAPAIASSHAFGSFRRPPPERY
jgi:hypothetical protein